LIDENLEGMSLAEHVNGAFVFHVPPNAITESGLLLLQSVVPLRLGVAKSTTLKSHGNPETSNHMHILLRNYIFVIIYYIFHALWGTHIDKEMYIKRFTRI
jgi:hypothetical protein